MIQLCGMSCNVVDPCKTKGVDPTLISLTHTSSVCMQGFHFSDYPLWPTPSKSKPGERGGRHDGARTWKRQERNIDQNQYPTQSFPISLLFWAVTWSTPLSAAGEINPEWHGPHKHVYAGHSLSRITEGHRGVFSMSIWRCWLMFYTWTQSYPGP